MKWFTPLLVRSYYNNQEQSAPIVLMPENGWDIDQIADIVGNTYKICGCVMRCRKFYGFLTKEEERAILLPHDGGFLFRFSQIAGNFALSVNKGGIIVTWRIGRKRF